MITWLSDQSRKVFPLGTRFCTRRAGYLLNFTCFFCPFCTADHLPAISGLPLPCLIAVGAKERQHDRQEDQPVVEAQGGGRGEDSEEGDEGVRLREGRGEEGEQG